MSLVELMSYFSTKKFCTQFIYLLLLIFYVMIILKMVKDFSQMIEGFSFSIVIHFWIIRMLHILVKYLYVIFNLLLKIIECIFLVYCIYFISKDVFSFSCYLKEKYFRLGRINYICIYFWKFVFVYCFFSSFTD